jgi:hypothetical protein
MESDPTALWLKINTCTAAPGKEANLNAWAFQSQTCARNFPTKSDKKNSRIKTESKLPASAGFLFDEARTTAAVLRDTMKWTPCSMIY